MPELSTFDAAPALHAYLLGRVSFDGVLGLQRRLAFDVAGARSHGALILCEHPRLVSIGRDGSRAHVLYEDDELQTLGLGLRWVNRGGGCVLHAPGQIAVYSILALDALGLHVQGYLDALNGLLADVLSGLGVPGVGRTQAGVHAHDRLVAPVGVAVSDWVSQFGAVVNVLPDLEPFRRVLVGGAGERAMT